MDPHPPASIWPPGHGGEGADQVLLTPFASATGRTAGAMLVLPGGGYVNRAPHEGSEVAQWLADEGFSAFVLDYRVAPFRHPYPLADAKRALRWIRCRADEYRIDPHRIGVVGFSAGGHLAASLATHWDEADEVPDDLGSVSCRPDCVVLGYPVVSFVQHVQVGSMQNLLGADPAVSLRELLSAERHVTPKTPPSFVWHGADDTVVPAQNSLLFAQALAECGVPFELHVFPRCTRHGVGLAQDIPRVAEWPGLCAEWLRELWK